MATATTRAKKPDLVPERFFFPQVGWAGSQSVLKLVENRRVRVTYDRGE